jgi:hypothetical protein
VVEAVEAGPRESLPEYSYYANLRSFRAILIFIAYALYEALKVRTVRLNHDDTARAEEPAQAGAPRSRPLDADPVNLTENDQPGEERSVAR